MSIRTHKIRIYPSKRQETMMRRHIGYQRVAYNHMLAEFKDALECDCEPACESAKRKKDCGQSEFLSAYSLRKRFNAAKRELYPWAKELSASVGDAAAENLKAAIAKWVDKKLPNGFPTFKKYHSARSYQASDGHWERNKVERRKVYLPKVGWVKMRESLRYEGKIRKITVSRTAKGWQVAISVEIPDDAPPADGAAVGVDVGIRNLAFVSDGRFYPNPLPLKNALPELRRVDKAIARSRNIHGRNKFSRRRSRLYHKRRLLHERIANIRQTNHRAVAADIAKSAGRVVVESLNVVGIVKNMGRSAADSALGGFLREIAWQCEKRGVELVEADRWFPSSKTCSRCGVKSELRRGARTFRCATCGYRADRDANAAMNLKNWFAYEPKRGESVRPSFGAAGINEARASQTDAHEPAYEYQPMLIPA